MKILVIDGGISNLGFIGADLPDDYIEREEIIKPEEIYICERIDIIELMKECKDPHCELYHDNIICDYMMHLFKKYKDDFESSKQILTERQPLTGITAVPELLMREYRSKCKYESPNEMLNFFNILQYDYEERKIRTVNFAMPYLSGMKNFMFNERRHDMADAFCLLYHFLHKERVKYKKQIEDEEFKYNNKNFIINMNKFKYES